MKAIQVDELLRFAQAALEAVGVGAENARTIANTLVTTDTFGVFSHGTNNLPGRIDTEMLAYATPERRAQWLQSTPLGRFGDTADIAELAVFLASDKGGYITGAKINVNGGLSTG